MLLTSGSSKRSRAIGSGRTLASRSDTIRPMTAPARATLWTAEELSRAGTPYERYELWDGVPVVKEPSGGPHGCIGARLLVRLALYVEARGLGSVWDSSAGFIVARRPDRV